MTLFRANEHLLSNYPEQAAGYNDDTHELVKAGYVVKINAEEVNKSEESWFIPHHLVCHNGKAKVVYNCSFT